MKIGYIKARMGFGFIAGTLFALSCSEKPALMRKSESTVNTVDQKAENAAETDPALEETAASQPSDSDDANPKEEVIPPVEPVVPEPEKPVEDECVRELKLMTYNLKFDNNNAASVTDENGWKNEKNPRRLRVKAILDKHAPDIIGTQEGKEHQIKDMKSDFKVYDFWGVGREDGKAKGEYAGIFYRKDLFKLQNGGNFWLSATPDKAGTTFPPESHSRMASWARLKENKSGMVFLVVNTHYALNAQSREASSELIVQQMKSVAKDGDQVLVFGDFNAFENKKEILILKEKLELNDTYRTIHKEKVAKEASVNGFKGVVDGQRIDFILAPPSLKIKSAEIIRDSSSGLFSSDHYPIQVHACLSK